MSSILTNNSAMVALQTLKQINFNLAKAQDEISTGKRIATAKDNAAVWAISKVMESDMAGFRAISASLGLGQSTVATARSASERVVELLNKVKEKIVAAQEQNVDRGKIQDDINALRSQISGITNAAQFNGLNLLDNSDLTPGSGTVEVLASLDRSGSGVTASSISVQKQDLSTRVETAGVTATNATGTTGTVAVNTTKDFAIFTTTPVAGSSYKIAAVGTTALTKAVTYVARDGDTLTSVATEMLSRLNLQLAKQPPLAAPVTFALSSTAGVITITTGATATTIETGNVLQSAAGANDGTLGGGLENLSNIDVTTNDGAEQALVDVEGLIQTAIKAAAAFGSAQGRIEIQNNFVSSLIDWMRSGVGALVDADMEESSALIQALQVQQQLGVQALSIANQAPQTILSLFR